MIMKWRGKGSRVQRSENHKKERRHQDTMEDKTKQKLFTLLYVVMIVVVIGTCIYLAQFLSGESASCLKDPIQYYSEKTNQMCYCNDGIGWANPNGNPDVDLNFAVIP